jgi:2-amino-4-hydroxy-6-hydroxymethyldihydropteridine diphosphokinase
MTEDVILGLGSNYGDRRAHLLFALLRLTQVLGEVLPSRVYESKAVLPPDAPPEWDLPYLNMAVGGYTHLSPAELLAEIKLIERDLGRQVRGFWGPREIDIDILAYGQVVMETPELTIPHPELLKRDFALLPLVDIDSEWRYPAEGTYKGWKASDIAAAQGFKAGEHLKDTGRLLDA